VIVVGEKSEGMNANFPEVNGIFNGFKEKAPVSIIEKEGVTIGSPVHDMIERSWIFDAKWTGHFISVSFNKNGEGIFENEGDFED